MPCYDSTSSSNAEAYTKTKERLDYLTRIVCEQCKQLEKERKLHILSPELFSWWKQHKAEDLLLRKNQR